MQLVSGYAPNCDIKQSDLNTDVYLSLCRTKHALSVLLSSILCELLHVRVVVFYPRSMLFEKAKINDQCDGRAV